MTIQSNNNDERQLHADLIHTLSERYHIDESTIRDIYNNKLEELRDQATITSFLPVLIERHVKNLLHDASDTYA